MRDGRENVKKSESFETFADCEIERIFREIGIDGDIGFDEDNEDFWKRKIIEVYNKMKKR